MLGHRKCQPYGVRTGRRVRLSHVNAVRHLHPLRRDGIHDLLDSGSDADASSVFTAVADTAREAAETQPTATREADVLSGEEHFAAREEQKAIRGVGASQLVLAGGCAGRCARPPRWDISGIDPQLRQLFSYCAAATRSNRNRRSFANDATDIGHRSSLSLANICWRKEKRRRRLWHCSTAERAGNAGNFCAEKPVARADPHGDVRRFTHKARRLPII